MAWNISRFLPEISSNLALSQSVLVEDLLQLALGVFQVGLENLQHIWDGLEEQEEGP